MGGAASFGQKAATKYKESSRQNAPKKYDDKVLVGSNGTFDSSPASEQVQSQLQANEVPMVNMRAGSYRPSKDPPTAVQKVEVSPSAQIDDNVSVAGSEQPSYRAHSKISKDADRKEQQETERNVSKRSAHGNNLTVEMAHVTSSPSKEPPAERERERRQGSKREEPPSSPRPMSNSRRPTAVEEKEKTVARTSSRKSTGQAKVEIVEADGSAALDIDAEEMRPLRSEKRATTIGLHQAHSEAREAILKARGVNTEDPMGGLQVGMKVMGTGKVGQEMGIGTVMRKGNTPGMVMVKMDESGREMALSVAKLQTLADDKMVKTAQTLVKRVPNRSSRRASTYN